MVRSRPVLPDPALPVRTPVEHAFRGQAARRPIDGEWTSSRLAMIATLPTSSLRRSLLTVAVGSLTCRTDASYHRGGIWYAMRGRSNDENVAESVLALAAVVVALPVSGSVGASDAQSGRATSPVTAEGDLTFYVVGAVASGSTFWDTVRVGAEQAGEDFGVEVVYTAPENHDTIGYIPILESSRRIGSRWASRINFLDKSVEQSTIDALDARLVVTLFNTREVGDPDVNPDTAVTYPRLLPLPFVGSDIFRGAESLGATLAGHLEPGTRFVVFKPVPGIAVLVPGATVPSRPWKTPAWCSSKNCRARSMKPRTRRSSAPIWTPIPISARSSD